MKIEQLFRFANSLLLGNWRSGGLNAIFLLIVTIITLLSSIAWYSDSIQQGIDTRAAELFGGDLLLKSTSVIPKTWITQTKTMGLKSSEVIYVNTLLEPKKQNDDFINISIKAVSESYPLYGKLRISSSTHTDQTEYTKYPPKPGTIWLEQRAANELHVIPGDIVEVGAAKLVFTHYLYEEPDGQLVEFKIAPRLLMSMDDLAKTKILQPRSKADFLLLVAGNVKPFVEWVKPLLGKGQKLTMAFDGRVELKAGFEQIIRYLKIGICLILLLAGSVINLGLKEYNARNDVIIAMLRCFGMYKSQIVIILVIQFFEIILLSGAVGLPCGFIMHKVLHFLIEGLLPGALPNQLNSIDWLIGIKAIFICALFLFAFGMQHWLGLSQIPPLRILRKDPLQKNKYWYLFYIVKFAVLTTIFYIYTQDIKLIVIGCCFLASMMVIVKICSLLASFLLKSISQFLPHLLQISALNIARYIQNRYLQIIAFTAISFAVSFTYLLQDSLINAWQKQVARQSANYFIFNIAPEQFMSLRNFILNNHLKIVDAYPILRGRLTLHNGAHLKPISSGQKIHNNALNRELNIAAVNNLPPDNQLIAGAWWDNNQSIKSEVSVESGLAQHFNIHVGDTLTFKIAEKLLKVSVSSIRKVSWGNLHPNFYMLLPSHVLDQYPSSYLMGIYLSTVQYALLDKLRKTYPALSILSITNLVQQSTHFFSQLSILASWIFSFVLIAGIVSQHLVLWSTRKQREFEAAMLKVLGMTSFKLLVMWLIEYGFYTLLASFIGIVLAYSLQLFLFNYFLQINPVFNALAMLILVGFNLAITLSFAILSIKKSIETTPFTLIRG